MNKTRDTTDVRLSEALGPAMKNWTSLIEAISAEFSPLSQEWKPTKLEFGSICLLKQKKRTLAYLIPGTRRFEVSVVLGERAVLLALASDLPDRIKTLISDARAYVEGRGIRFPLRSAKDVQSVVQLVRFKTTPR